MLQIIIYDKLRHFHKWQQTNIYDYYLLQLKFFFLHADGSVCRFLWKSPLMSVGCILVDCVKLSQSQGDVIRLGAAVSWYPVPKLVTSVYGVYGIINWWFEIEFPFHLVRRIVSSGLVIGWCLFVWKEELCPVGDGHSPLWRLWASGLKQWGLIGSQCF